MNEYDLTEDEIIVLMLIAGDPLFGYEIRKMVTNEDRKPADIHLYQLGLICAPMDLCAHNGACYTITNDGRIYLATKGFI